MSQTYKNLQEENNKKFEQDPATSGSGIPGFNSNQSNNNFTPSNQNRKPNKNVNKLAPEYVLSDDFKKQMHDNNGRSNTGSGGIEGNLNTGSISTIGHDTFSTKLFGIDIGIPKSNQDIFNPYTGFNVMQDNVNLEEVLSSGQSRFTKTLNLGSQFIGKTAVNAVGGVVGSLYGVGSAIANAEFNKIYDNSVNRYFDGLTESIEKNNTINVNSNDSFFSFKSIKGIGDAFSFIAGAVGSELIMQTAGNALGGAGLATAAARFQRYGKILSGTKASKASVEIAKGFKQLASLTDELQTATKLGAEGVEQATKLTKDITNLSKSLGFKSVEEARKLMELTSKYNSALAFTRNTMTGTMWEAGLEARQAKDSFIDRAMKAKEYEVMNDPKYTDEESRKKAIETYKKEVEELGDRAGNLTFGLNVGILKISNAIQFPSLFGNTKGKLLSKASGKIEAGSTFAGLSRRADGSLQRKTLKELAGDGSWLTLKNIPGKVKGLGSQTNRIVFGSKLARIVKNPLTEAAEEYGQYLASQSSENYYDNVLSSRYNVHPDVEKDITGLAGNFLDFFKATGKALGDSSENNAWDEAIIGGIVGATGIPAFKKNASGKRVFTTMGGVMEDLKAYKEEQAKRDKIIELYDVTQWNKDIATSLKRDTQNATIAANNADKRDSQVGRASIAGLKESRSDALFTNVFQKLVAGTDSFLSEDVNELNNINLDTTEGLEQFKSLYMNEIEIANLSEEELRTKAKADRSQVVETINKVYEAYNSVVPGIAENMANLQMFDEDMLRFMTYSVYNAESKVKQIEELNQSILEKAKGALTEQDLEHYGKVSSMINEDLKSTIQFSKLKEFKAQELISALEEELGNIEDRIIKDRGKLGVVNRKNIKRKSKALKSIKNDLSSIREAYKTKLDKLEEIKDTEQKEIEKSKLQESHLKEVSDIYANLLNDINKGKDGIISIMQSKEEITGEDVQNYLNSIIKLNKVSKQLGQENLTSTDFKDINNQNSLKDNLEELAELQEQRLLHQKVANYFYSNIGNPNEIFKSFYLADIQKASQELAININLLKDLVELDAIEEASVKEAIITYQNKLDDLYGLIKVLKDNNNVDYLEEGSKTAEYFKEYIEDPLNDLAKKFNIEKKKEEEAEKVKKVKKEEEVDEVEEAQEDDLEDSKVKKYKAKKPGEFNTAANRLVFNLNTLLNKEVKEKLINAVTDGSIKSEVLVNLVSTLQNASHETEEWFTSLGLDKDIYSKGKQAILANRNVIDEAFRIDNLGNKNTGGKEVKVNSVKLGDSVIDISSDDLIKELKAFKDNLVQEGTQLEEVDYTELYNKLSRFADIKGQIVSSKDPANTLTEEQREEEINKVNELTRALFLYTTTEDTSHLDKFAHLVDIKVAAKRNISTETNDIVEAILNANPSISKTVSKYELGLFVQDNKVKLEKVEHSKDSTTDLYEAVRYYVSNMRVNINITDKHINDETTKEANTVVSDIYLPSVSNIYSTEYLDDIESKINEIEKQIEVLQKEEAEGLADGSLTKFERNRIAKDINNLLSKQDTLREYRNDRSNIEFRKEAIKNGTNSIKLNTVNLGNIQEGQPEFRNEDGSIKPINEVVNTEEFNILGDNMLADSIEDFIENVVYMSADKKLKNIRNEEVVLTRTVDGMTDLKVGGETGTTFYIHTDITGKRTPIKLNNGNLSDNLIEAIIVNLEVALSDTSAKIAPGINTALNPYIMQVRKSGQVPSTFGNAFRFTENIKTLDIVDRDFNSISITPENIKDPIIKEKLKAILKNTRAKIAIGKLVDKTSGEVNVKALERILDNKTLNTSIDTKRNFDKVFEYNEDGSPDISLVFTTSEFDVNDDSLKTIKNTRVNFIKRLNQLLLGNLRSEETSGVAFEIKLKNQLLQTIGNEFSKVLKEHRLELDEYTSELLDRYENALKTSDLSEFSKGELKEIAKVNKAVATKVFNNIFNTTSTSFLKMNNPVYALQNLKRTFSVYYAESNPTDFHVLNKVENFFNDIKKQLSNPKGSDKLYEYAYLIGTGQEVLKSLNEKNRKQVGNKNEPHFEMKAGKLVVNEEGKELISNYLDLLSRVSSFSAKKDGVLPIKFIFYDSNGKRKGEASNYKKPYKIVKQENNTYGVYTDVINEYQVEKNKKDGTKWSENKYVFNLNFKENQNGLVSIDIPVGLTLEDIQDLLEKSKRSTAYRQAYLNSITSNSVITSSIDTLNEQNAKTTDKKLFNRFVNTKFTPNNADTMAFELTAQYDRYLSMGHDKIDNINWFSLNPNKLVYYEYYNTIIRTFGEDAFKKDFVFGSPVSKTVETVAYETIDGVRAPKYTYNINEADNTYTVNDVFEERLMLADIDQDNILEFNISDLENSSNDIMKSMYIFDKLFNSTAKGDIKKTKKVAAKKTKSDNPSALDPSKIVPISQIVRGGIPFEDAFEQVSDDIFGSQDIIEITTETTEPKKNTTPSDDIFGGAGEAIPGFEGESGASFTIPPKTKLILALNKLSGEVPLASFSKTASTNSLINKINTAKREYYTAMGFEYEGDIVLNDLAVFLMKEDSELVKFLSDEISNLTENNC